MQIVHTDNRLITADCDSGKRQIRPLVSESAPYQQACNCLTEMKSVLSPTWVLYTKTDWPTDFDLNLRVMFISDS
jgi:hypothetical protein